MTEVKHNLIYAIARAARESGFIVGEHSPYEETQIIDPETFTHCVTVWKKKDHVVKKKFLFGAIKFKYTTTKTYKIADIRVKANAAGEVDKMNQYSGWVVSLYGEHNIEAIDAIWAKHRELYDLTGVAARKNIDCTLAGLEKPHEGSCFWD